VGTTPPVGQVRLTDPQGVLVVLTAERWAHILTRRKEMVPHRQDLEHTVTAPDAIYQKGTARIYFKRVVSPKHGRMHLRATVVKHQDHFVVTAWLMPEVRPKGAVQIWPTPCP